MYFHTPLLPAFSFSALRFFPLSLSTHSFSPIIFFFLSLFSIPLFLPLSSDQSKNRTGEALSPLPARRLISIFMRSVINYTWDPEGKQRQKNETRTHILAHTFARAPACEDAHMQVHTHTHADAHILTFSSSHTLSQSHSTDGEIQTGNWWERVCGTVHWQCAGETAHTILKGRSRSHSQSNRKCSAHTHTGTMLRLAVFFSTLKSKRV